MYKTYQVLNIGQMLLLLLTELKFIRRGLSESPVRKYSWLRFVLMNCAIFGKDNTKTIFSIEVVYRDRSSRLNITDPQAHVGDELR